MSSDPPNAGPKRRSRGWLIATIAIVGTLLFTWAVASGIDSAVSRDLSGLPDLPSERQERSIALDSGDIVSIVWDPIEKRQTYVNGELVEGYSASVQRWNEADVSARTCSALQRGAELLTRDADVNEEAGELASAARRRAYSQFMMDEFDTRCMD
jgi:hypothetical protein